MIELSASNTPRLSPKALPDSLTANMRARVGFAISLCGGAFYWYPILSAPVVLAGLLISMLGLLYACALNRAQIFGFVRPERSGMILSILGILISLGCALGVSLTIHEKIDKERVRRQEVLQMENERAMERNRRQIQEMQHQWRRQNNYHPY